MKAGLAADCCICHHWEYYPLSQREIDFVVENIMMIADYRLIKIIIHGEVLSDSCLPFPMSRLLCNVLRGKLNPLSLADLLLEMKRTSSVSANGMGILPEFQGHGGNAILYAEMGHTLLDFRQFQHVEMTQVAETTEQMRADLKNLNGVEYKNHRVYRKSI